MIGKDFYIDEWEFTFPHNGDRYSGSYVAHKSGIAWRDGIGTYYTHDKQIYKGIWKDDKLNESEQIEITFSNDDVFNGKLSKFKYQGPGSYTFKDGGVLSAQFLCNQPINNIIYIDPHKKLWYGTARTNYTFLVAEHAFSSELDEKHGKGKLLNKDTLDENYEEESCPGETTTYEPTEQSVFHKSTKTLADIDFEDSDWYRDFLDFKKAYSAIFEKITQHGIESLGSNEKIWYKKFLKNMKMVQKQKDEGSKKTKWTHLHQYLNDNVQNTCSPLRVVYPSKINKATQLDEEELNIILLKII